MGTTSVAHASFGILPLLFASRAGPEHSFPAIRAIFTSSGCVSPVSVVSLEDYFYTRYHSDRQHQRSFYHDKSRIGFPSRVQVSSRDPKSLDLLRTTSVSLTYTDDSIVGRGPDRSCPPSLTQPFVLTCRDTLSPTPH